MDPVEAIIDQRRSLRALEPVDPKADLRELADQLTSSARLAPSADNSQPWRFVSVYKDPQLAEIRAALAPGNQWASVCSLFIVVCASPALSLTGPSTTDKNGPINYYLYDTGLASAFLMLRATDFHLVAHPIAGFDSVAVARAIVMDQSTVPALQVVALMAIGKKSENPAAIDRVPENLQEAERVRPNRKPLESIAFHNVFAEPVSVARPSEERKNFDRDIVLVNDDGKIYHIEQATLDAMISVDELNLEDQVAYGFIKELKDLGISVAAIPNITGMTASIFCYLLNLGSLKPPLPDSTTTTENAIDAPNAETSKPGSARGEMRKRRHRQYSGAEEA